MTADCSERHPVDRLAEEFVARYRRGERPSISEYTAKYPELADKLQEILAALVLMEEHAPARAPLDESSAEASAGRIADAAAARRVFDPPRAGPRRHGRRLRGGAGVARPARGPQGAAVALADRPAAARSASSTRRRRPPGCTTRTSCRSSASAWRRASTSTPCSSSRGAAWMTCSTSCGG